MLSWIRWEFLTCHQGVWKISGDYQVGCTFPLNYNWATIHLWGFYSFCKSHILKVCWKNKIPSHTEIPSPSTIYIQYFIYQKFDFQKQNILNNNQALKKTFQYISSFKTKTKPVPLKWKKISLSHLHFYYLLYFDFHLQN